MTDNQHNEDNVRALCLNCGGHGVVKVPRLFVSMATEIGETVIDVVPCKVCKDSSGFQSGGSFQPPV